MRVRDITAAIEAFAPLSAQEEWDNSGLCIGEGEDGVRGVLVGFDCTPALILEAVETGCDMVVTHHPLLFRGIRRISAADPVGEAVVLAVRHGVKVYAAHTSADKVTGGVSWAMARRLGLTDIRILDAAPDGLGLGTVGEWPEGKTAAEALAFLKETFRVPCVRASRPVEGLIRTVAMCGGSGSSLIDKARAAGAGLYVSADISYHHFFTPAGFMVADIGHFESEVEIVDILFTLLKKNFPTFAIRKSGDTLNSNPIFYF